MLTEYTGQLHLLAGALLEYETLSGEEIKRIAAGEGIGREQDGTPSEVRPLDGHAGSIPQVRRRPRPSGDIRPQGA